MHTSGQKPRTNQQTTYANSALTKQSHIGKSREVNSPLHSQRMTGNQSVQPFLQTKGGDHKDSQRTSRTSGYADNFSRIALHTKADDGVQPKPTENRTGMSDELKTGLENSSGLDLSNVRVHRNSPEPAKLNALAITQGQTIHLAPNQDRHLPHEGWHVVQQLQGRVKANGLQLKDTTINTEPSLEAEADRMGNRATYPVNTARQPQHSLRNIHLGTSPRLPVQREVRINGGSQRINEAEYLPGGSKNAIGSRHSVESLIQDNTRRVFDSVAELEGYANGQTDFIGDVQTSSAGTFWYRLPENDLTILGEQHHNPRGNVPDVIVGLQTSRFMYEPIHEFTSVSPLDSSQIGSGTQTRTRQIEGGLAVGSMIDRANFDPHLENIVIKGLTGASIARNEFIASNPSSMSAAEIQTWSGRPTTSDYSIGERVALYLSMAIHIASDISQYNFGPEILIESNYYNSARHLAEFYLTNLSVLDAFMTVKDNDDLIGIYELTAHNNFADLQTINDFTIVFHEYGSRYIEQLGAQVGNVSLETAGTALSGNLAATLTTFSAPREEIMWERIQHANSSNYLIVGMGDAHRQNLEPRLNAAGIRHEEVEQGLNAQQARVNSRWTP